VPPVLKFGGRPNLHDAAAAVLVKKFYEYQVVSGIDAGLPDERRKSAADRMSDEWRSKHKTAFSVRFCAAWMYFRHDPIFGVSR
jgi:hypothetical protein